MRRFLRQPVIAIAVAIVSASCDIARPPARPTSLGDAQGAASSVAASPVAPATAEWRCLVTTPFPPADCPARAMALHATAADAFGPSPPANPQVLTVNVTGARVLLTWSPPISGVAPTSYVLEAGSAVGLSDLVNTDTGSAATFFAADNVPGGTYYVRVRAKNSGGTSGASNEVQVIVGGGLCTVAPGAPTLSVAIVHRTFTLTWSAAPGAPTSYVIEGGSNPGETNLANFDTGSTVTSYSALVDPGNYYIRVRAKNACGRSNASNEVNAFLPGYSIAFRPLLAGPDLGVCGATPNPICAQSFTPRGELGVFNEIWEPSRPVLAVSGSVTDTNFSMTMQCTNGRASGSVTATWDGEKYVGTWTFNGASGTVRIERGLVDTMCKVP